MIDKVINVPVAGDSVTNTLNLLPRTMDEAGLIEVTFKRKLEYKTSHHRGQLVNPKKLYKVLDHLKASGNPFYQFYDDINTFTERLEEATSHLSPSRGGGRDPGLRKTKRAKKYQKRQKHPKR